ncbi:Phosphopantothenoylcysteine decarboxylase (EC / Phosphopantothenoylcysteine synthetase (EC [uncultured Gammaproteobacteria bacterium]|nr:Phosphopantothenoylcysteine decarboxylase (EC / Phosphopantothenoylcysteine synthetase (EC [uncultured Gammaproteobacteria bacterium]
MSIASLTNKNILLGVSGSIAAYKAPDIVRRLQDLGAEVRVILTRGGSQFITELSLQVTSKNKVHIIYGIRKPNLPWGILN